jgi:hypothetical protein
MKHLPTFEQFICESKNYTSRDFPKLEEFIESLIPKGKRIQLFVEGHRILIGYFPDFASMADLSKPLPEKVNRAIQEKFAGTFVTVMTQFEKPDKLTGKKMTFTALSVGRPGDEANFEKIESLI